MLSHERPVVLVAARDAPIRRLVSGALRSDGFAPAQDTAFREPVDAIAELHPDLVVVESQLAETAAGRELREHAEAESIPVLWLGRRAGAQGAVEALDQAGADDYVSPPFDPVELGARVRALLRRKGRVIEAGQRRVGRATVDFDRREIRVDNARRSPARADWAILARLLADEGLAVASDELLSAGFGSAFRDDVGRLRPAVARLRRALGAEPGRTGPIRAVRGIGYRIEP